MLILASVQSTFALFILWHPVQAFVESIETDINEVNSGRPRTLSERKKKWAEISCQYSSLKDLTNMINQAKGHLMTMFLCGCVLGYGMRLDQIQTEFKNPNKFS